MENILENQVQEYGVWVKCSEPFTGDEGKLYATKGNDGRLTYQVGQIRITTAQYEIIKLLQQIGYAYSSTINKNVTNALIKKGYAVIVDDKIFITDKAVNDLLEDIEAGKKLLQKH